MSKPGKSRKKMKQEMLDPEILCWRDGMERSSFVVTKAEAGH